MLTGESHGTDTLLHRYLVAAGIVFAIIATGIGLLLYEHHSIHRVFDNPAVTVDMLHHTIHAQLKNTIYIVAALMGFITLVVLFEARFIFAPMARNIKDKMRELDKRRQSAEESDRLKSEFLATMSHEIRSPMSGVLGMTELLLQTNLTQLQRSYVTTISNSGESLFRIIEDILDFSKLESNRMQLNLQPLNMLDLVDDICALYSPKAREKALEIAAHYTPGSEQFVYADSGRMRQILGNLVNNAIKFTDSGHITINVSEDRSRTAAADGVWLKIVVSDTGIGIPADFQGKVFDKFSQYDGSDARSYSGMGLGLSVCRRLVDMMGGEISVASAPGHGTEFVLCIPFRRNHSERVDYPKPPILKDVRIIAIDDLECVRTVIKEQLELAGARCDTAENSEIALMMMCEAAHRGAPYQIALIDYLMPGMNGETFARTLHNDQSFKDLCMVMVTAAGTTVNADEFRRGNFSALISKPLKNRVLIESLAVIWHRFLNGEKGSIIQVDNISLAAKDPDNDHAQFRGARILLAEDSRVNQIFAEEILEQMGCSVTIVTNGQEAIEQLKLQSFDLVLMDCQMPMMDGFEATRILRAEVGNPHLQTIPVIALTANAMEGDRERCLAAGMTDYVSKPVRARELKDKIHYWLNRTERRQDGMPMPIPTPANLVDLETVLEARRVLKDKYEETLSRFLQDVAVHIGEIESAVARGDVSAIVRPAHTLKSTSRLMGVPQLSDLALDLEKTAKAPQTTDLSALRAKLAMLSATFDETQRQLVKISA